jgi:formate dehydrogenase subunit gamma
MTTAERKSKSKPFMHALFGAPPAEGEKQIERYSRPVRILHWVNAVAWIVLFITGFFFFVPQFGAPAAGGVSGLLHRIAAVVMVGWAAIYFVGSPKAALRGIGEAFKWGASDIGWLKAAPAYYMLGDEEKMPPQDHMNTGQKLWWLFVLGMGAVMIVTGALMWFFKGMISADAFIWMAFFHDVGFIALLSFALLHVYLSSFHPKMRGIFWSMWRGTVSAKYAESHHKKWYDEVEKG